MHESTRVPISVVIPTWQRPDLLSATLKKIYACSPAPDEVLVHIDSGDHESVAVIKNNFPDVKIYKSKTRQGPGGGRNILVHAAENEIVATFDDESYPIDTDYFSRLLLIFNHYPDASLVASAIVHRQEKMPDCEKTICTAGGFVNCGAAIRKKDFIDAGGYVALPLAYCMEETDLALRLIARGKKIYFSSWLRVFHDTDRSHQAAPEINAAAITNVALLAFLRYPLLYFPYGLLQVLNRVIWSMSERRFRGILGGLSGIPSYLWKYRNNRMPIPLSVFSHVVRTIRNGNGKQEPIVFEK